MTISKIYKRKILIKRVIQIQDHKVNIINKLIPSINDLSFENIEFSPYVTHCLSFLIGNIEFSYIAKANVTN